MTSKTKEEQREKQITLIESSLDDAGVSGEMTPQDAFRRGYAHGVTASAISAAKATGEGLGLTDIVYNTCLVARICIEHAGLADAEEYRGALVVCDAIIEAVEGAHAAAIGMAAEIVSRAAGDGEPS